MIREFERWPAVKKMYLKAFEDMIEKRKEDGLNTDYFTTAEGVMNWWLGKRMLYYGGQIQMEFDQMMEDTNGHQTD